MRKSTCQAWKRSLLDSRGILHVPMAIVFAAFALATFALLGLSRDWRRQVETQLRLDRCVAKISVEFRDRIVRIERLNQRIREIRLALAAATISPQASTAFRTALRAAVALQEVERSAWLLRQTQWIALRGCDRKDLPFPLPSPPWIRDPPDLLGEQPLRWKADMPRIFRIQLRHSPRLAAAVIQEKSTDERRFWKAEWTPGTDRLPRPSTD